MKAYLHSKIYGFVLFGMFLCLAFPSLSQIAIPENICRCDSTLKTNFISLKDFKQYIGKHILILPIDTNAVNVKGHKLYRSMETPFFFKDKTLNTKHIPGKPVSRAYC
jgi:hypothetical protein